MKRISSTLVNLFKVRHHDEPLPLSREDLEALQEDVALSVEEIDQIEELVASGHH